MAKTPDKPSHRRTFGGDRTARLTPLQRRFVALFLVSDSATQAAIKAGCKPHSASVTAYKWLISPHIEAEITAQRRLLAEKTAWSQARVIAQLTPIAEASMEDLLDFSGPTITMRPAPNIPVRARRAIASVKVKVRPGHGARAAAAVEALRGAARSKDAAKLQAALGKLAELEAATPEAPILDVVEFKLYDKLAATDQIAKHLGLYAPTKLDIQTARRELAQMLGVAEEQLPVPAPDAQTVH